jgi:hypothetical protein
MKKSFIIFFFICCGVSYSQKSDLTKRVEILSNKGIFIENQELEKLSEKDFKIISTYNFDKNRVLNAEKLVQLANGPVIRLNALSKINIDIHVDENVQLLDIGLIGRNDSHSKNNKENSSSDGFADKFPVEQYYIINDKPVTREQYLLFLSEKNKN